MSIWKWCHLKCQLQKHFPLFYSFKLCRRYLQNRSSKKTILSHIRLTCRPSTLKMRNTSSTAPNAIKKLERSTAGITRVLVDVSCSSCSLSNLLASHSSQLPISGVLFVQALQTSSKTNTIWLVTWIIGRAKNIGLLGQSLAKLATRIIYAVAIWLDICIISRPKNDFEPISGCLGEGFANDANLEITSFKSAIWKNIFPCYIR